MCQTNINMRIGAYAMLNYNEYGEEIERQAERIKFACEPAIKLSPKISHFPLWNFVFH